MSEKLSVVCLDFKPLCRNTLRGFAVVNIEQMRIVMREVAIHSKGDKAWAQLPSRPWLKTGQVVTNIQGKIQHAPLLEFDSGEVRAAFSNAVIRALLEYDGSALECRGDAA
jgi:hypothetical protein